VRRSSSVRRTLGRSRNWSWAFIAMGLSSVTTLCLTLLAGRSLGASGLGVVYTGFMAYISLLALHRAVITTPLISDSSTLGEGERLVETRKALTATLAAGLALAAVTALLGAAIRGPIGLGLLVFAPWLVPAFVQELFRASLFRDGRGRQAAVMQIAWLATVVLCAPIAARIDSTWAVVSAWGAGSVVAAMLGVLWARGLPSRLPVAWAWFRSVALPFGRWLALQEGSFVIGFYGLVVILTAILGAADVGGLRAADSVFAPFTLLAPALMLAGLPAVSRSVAVSRAKALQLAAAISAFCVLLILAYSAVMFLAGDTVLPAVFGDDFEPYVHLVVPMSVWQIALGAGLGFAILLRAEQRGRAILVSGTAMLAASLLASPLLAAAAGVEGAVWGLGIGAAVGTVFSIYLALRPSRDQAPSALESAPARGAVGIAASGAPLSTLTSHGHAS
jgi:O-antigen/teichoic acid export membrane protein